MNYIFDTFQGGRERPFCGFRAYKRGRFVYIQYRTIWTGDQDTTARMREETFARYYFKQCEGDTKEFLELWAIQYDAFLALGLAEETARREIK